jgi:hypothetical protein
MQLSAAKLTSSEDDRSVGQTIAFPESVAEVIDSVVGRVANLPHIDTPDFS